MNRQQLRDYCCRLRGWELTHDDDLSKVDALIDQSLRDISSDAPGALLPSVEHVVLWPDLTNTTEAFTVDVLGTDRYVLEFNNPIVYAGMKTTGEWDGLFWIEVKDPSGVWHRRQVLEFWAQGDPIVFRISIQNPWPNATDADMEWRLYQPFTYTQDDVIDVLGGRSYSAEQQRVTTQRYRHSAPQASRQVNRNRADGIIDGAAHQQPVCQPHRQAAACPDQQGVGNADRMSTRGDSH